MNWWQHIINYYKKIGENYHVDPILFVGIHAVDTPLFVMLVGWIIFRYRRKKSILLLSFIAVVVFNAANIYLIVYGRHIPFWIYAFVAATTLISAYLTFRKIKKKIGATDPNNQSNHK